MSGLLTSDYGLTADPVQANALALGAPARPRVQPAPGSADYPLPATPGAPTVAGTSPPPPKNSGDTFAIAERQRQRGENASGDPNAQNPHSSAGGKNQIIDETWLDLLRRNKPELVQGKTREELIAMKVDPALNDEMARAYDQQNAKTLASNGIAPTPNALNVMYRAGPGDGMKIMQAAHQNPQMLVKDVAPALASPGNNGAGNMTVGQFLMDPYARGPGGSDSSSPQQIYSIAKGNQILGEMLSDVQEGKSRVRSLDRDYKPVEIAPPPKPPDTDPLATFGSLAGVFATLAAGFSRTPAIAAMNGLSGAMDAAKKNDWDQYKAHYEQWKQNTDNMFHAHDVHSKDVRDALEMMTKNISAGTAMMNATLALSQDEEMQKLHSQQRYVEMADLQMRRDRNAQEMQTGRPLAEASAQLSAAMHNFEAASKSGDPAEIERARVLVQQAETRVAEVNQTKYGTTGRGSGSAQIRDAVTRQIMQEHPEMSPADAMLEADRRIQGNKGSNFSAPQLATITGGDGETRVELVQQDRANGQWVTADERRAPVSGVRGLMKPSDAPAVNDKNVSEVARMISEYRMAPLSAFALKTPFGQAVMAEVGKINPDFEGSQFQARSKAARDFSTGRQGQAINSFNVAIAHLGTLSELATAMQNHDLQAINRLSNTFQQQTGGAAPTNFDAAKQIIGQEIIKAIIAGGGGVSEREEAGKRLSAAQSPEQLQGVIDTYKKLMAGQLGGLKQQYEQTTGLHNFDERLSSDALELLRMKEAGQHSDGPKIGDIEQGYRFKGGNAAEPSSWEPVH